MNFVMPRNFTVKGFGHSIAFVKDQPQHVPPILYTEVRKYGGVPEEAVDEDESSTSNLGETADIKPRDPQGEDRMVLIEGAIAKLVSENDSTKFGGNGAPSVQALTDIVGFRVQSTERNQGWTEFNLRIQAEMSPSNVSQPAIDPLAVDNVS